ncbi:Hypothetical predicted protein [Paramuricea clavata]|uniref:Uncharacterized protein n=1 Tax=Paramuricea clavata TaxID=317549 RepID=A0A6S7IC70_PARCT|nr:Hypothetical predicted protein [Paramuricea clavata]
MKRVRSVVESCHLCDVHFESNNGYIKHCETRNHKHKLLVKNAATMVIDEEIDNSFPTKTVPEIPPFFPFTSQGDQQEMMATPLIFEDDSQDNPSSPIQHEMDAEDNVNEKSNLFYPFPDEKFFLLYCYSHGIMRPKSRADLDFLWMMLDRFGVNPPLLDSVLSFKIDGLEDMLPLNKAYGEGHPFYWIPPSKIIQMQLATPTIAQQIARYPEKTQNIIEEMYQGRKWHICEQFHTTSATVHNKTIFVDDVIQYTSRQGNRAYGKVQNFFAQKVDDCLKSMCEVLKVNVHPVHPDHLVITDEIEDLDINDINGITTAPLSFKEIDGQIYHLTPEEIDFHCTPHPSKAAAGELESGMMMYDVLSGNEIFVQCPILCVACDNPRASEICHHLGSTAKHFCRDCDATKENATEIGNARTDEAIKNTIVLLKMQDLKMQKKLLRRETGVTECGGQFDELKTFDATEQTPIEILHTILLGSEKYLLGKTMKTLSAANKMKIKARIEAFDFSAFPQKIASSITRMHGSLVGRDCKVWAKVAVFLLMDIVSDDELEVWYNLSDIFAIAYNPCVNRDDREKMDMAISHFLETVENVHPEFLRKPKIHMLLHLPDDIFNFGPAIGFATERFEALNSIIRQINVFSNRQACSRDIGKKFVQHQIQKFVLNGGCWGVDYRKCASQQLQHLAKSPKLAKFMYQDDPKTNSEKEIYQPGSLRLGKYTNGRLQKLHIDAVFSTPAIEEHLSNIVTTSNNKCNYLKAAFRMPNI